MTQGSFEEILFSVVLQQRIVHSAHGNLKHTNIKLHILLCNHACNLCILTSIIGGLVLEGAFYFAGKDKETSHSDSSGRAGTNTSELNQLPRAAVYQMLVPVRRSRWLSDTVPAERCSVRPSGDICWLSWNKENHLVHRRITKVLQQRENYTEHLQIGAAEWSSGRGMLLSNTFKATISEIRCFL